MNDENHITPAKSGTIEITHYLGGTLNSIRKVKPKKPYTSFDGDYHKGNHTGRGRSVGQSYGSRRNQHRQMSMVNRSKLDCVEKLVTTTYGDMPDPLLLKRHLDNLCKWLIYHNPFVTGYWKLEDQEQRSSREDEPDLCFHFHLLLYNQDFLPNQKLNDYWNKLTKSKVKQVTRVEDVRTPQQVHSYLNKYLSKKVHNEKWNKANLGRTWGKLNRRELAKLIDERKIFIGAEENFDPRPAPISFDRTINSFDDLKKWNKTTPDVFIPRNAEDEVIVVPDDMVDELHLKIKKLLIKYLDSCCRKRWGKNYNKSNNYDFHKKEVGVDTDTGEIRYKKTHQKIRDHRLYIFLTNATLEKIIQYISGDNTANSIHHRINQRGETSK